ncbi:MAG: hypothetical protein WC710_14020 [Gallionella sp.]|jgi:hypothetical protein
MLDFNLIGMDKIAEKLEKLPDAIGDAGVEQANNYMLNVLITKEIPPYKYISYKQAYGKAPAGGFFYKLKHGLIDVPYIRRGKGNGVSGSWMISGAGRNAYLSNPDPAAHWLYSENQARMMQLIGWRRVSQIIDRYTKQIVASFTRGVATAIRRVGL